MSRCSACPVLTGVTCFNDAKGLTARCTKVVAGDAAQTWLAGTNSEGAAYICRTDLSQATALGVDCSSSPPVVLSDGPAPVFRKTVPTKCTDAYKRLLAARAACPHLGPVCDKGCGGDVHTCLANASPWPGQPGKAALCDCQSCPLLPVLG